ncbi:DMSO/TMAO reductase YedYZ molybdopterin-dependent catalytic subunit [Fictibacillus barbaricus]|uniref:DMSO/TMAO reductase YedYZ molybdopterin-dependent catalytic subunit n=2 Tax=Fictibacillus barbaricus TaxID=182136 RepID=A0ABU1U1T6_9BACL|nr:DMSO/TMAO reductase YedYZ molybdopterin-dependent catalytic subunit [Fictibacillus barbaricus]
MGLNKADRIKKMRVPEVDKSLEGRLPPGQVLTERFPILHEGEVPVYDMEKWTLSAEGLVGKEVEFCFEDIMKMPQTKVVRDIHCVTRWSRFDNTFEGVLFKDFLKAIDVDPAARFVMVHGDYDYTTNVPLEDLLRDDVLLAHSFEGKPLTDKHGYPLRLVVPHLYFWKSAKWIRKFEFLAEDQPGFWEQNDFHMYGDPFKEERFSGEGFEMPEDEWKKKDFD